MGILILNIFLLSLFLFGCTSANDGVNINCLNANTKKIEIIYLHGMDTKLPSAQELNNRKILKTTALLFDAALSIPRAQMTCPQSPNQICWGWTYNKTEVNNIEKIIAESSCKLINKKIIIGFSNGGYALNNLYQQGLLKNYSLIVTAGAGFGKQINNMSDFKNYGKLKILVGKNDSFNYDPKREFYNYLKLKKADAEQIEFNGTHEINESLLIKTIKDNL